MVAIRLSRTGKKKKPSYRVVVIDKRRARDSRNIEIVGHYNPRPDPIEVVLKRDRIDYWMSVGAQPSDTVKRLVKVYDIRHPAEPEEPEVESAETSAGDAASEAVPVKASGSQAMQPGQPTDEDPGDDWPDDADIEVPEDLG